MRGPHGMPSHELDEIGARTRCIDGVLSRLETIEPEFSFLVGPEFAAQIVSRLVLWVKNIVLAVGAGLPHVEYRILDPRPRLRVADHTVEEGELTVRGHVLHNAGTELAERSFWGPEGAENGGGGRRQLLLCDDLVVDFVDETGSVSVRGQPATWIYARFNAKIVADSPGLISVLPICLANGVYIVDADNPFFLGELDLPTKVVHVAYERAEDFSVAWFCVGAHQVDDMLCEVRIKSARLVLGVVGGAVCSHGVVAG